MKSLDDYKQIVKILKQRIYTIQSEQDELKNMTEYKSFIDDQLAIKELQKASQRIGITLEMIFRAADVQSMGVISCYQMAQFLTKIRIRDQVVQKLIQLFDEDNNSTITRKEFQDSLRAYGINTQQSDSDYKRQSFVKYAKFIQREKFDGPQGYYKMDPQRIGYIKKELFMAFTLALNDSEKQITKKEIVAAYNYLDITKENKVTQQQYLDGLATAYKAILPYEQPINRWEMIQTEFRRMQVLKGIVLYTLMVDLMKSIKYPERGIFYKHIIKILPKLNRKECMDLFQLMDIGMNGSVDYDELMLFYQIVALESDTFEPLFLILAVKLKAMHISIEKYLRYEQIYSNTQIQPSAFIDIWQKLFNSTPETAERLFRALDQDQSQTVSAAEIIRYVNQSVDKLWPDMRKDEVQEIQSKIRTIDEQYLWERADGSYSNTIFINGLECYKVVSELAAKQIKWIDSEFGPNRQDPHGSKSICFSVNNLPIGWPNPSDLEWKSASGAVSTGNASVNNVLQSQYLGDCWFISALTILAKNDEYLFGERGIFPKCFHKFALQGIYIIKFYKNFKEVFVVVDDRLPFYNGEYIFSSCRDTDIWVQMIEKAYAKLHNCYEALNIGDTSAALYDLTGLPAVKIDMQFESLKQSFMACSTPGTGIIDIDGENTGLFKSHSYAILHAFEIQNPQLIRERKTHRLVMLRNPWGYGEWKLKWSDQSEILQTMIPFIDKYFEKKKQESLRLSEEPIEAFKIENDGIFLMNYKKFSQVFTNLITLITEPMNEMRFEYQFTGDEFGHYDPNKPDADIKFALNNPQFIIWADQNTKIIIRITQEDGRLTHTKYPFNAIPLQLQIFKLLKSDPKSDHPTQNEQILTKYRIESRISNSSLSRKRDIYSQILDVTSGKYSIIPTASQVGKCTIVIYHDKQILLQQNGKQVKSQTIVQDVQKQFQNMIKLYIKQSS